MLSPPMIFRPNGATAEEAARLPILTTIGSALPRVLSVRQEASRDGSGVSRGEEQIPCPVCRKPRVASQMERHIEDKHTHAGHTAAQEKGYKRGGKGRRPWWKEQLSQW